MPNANSTMLKALSATFTVLPSARRSRALIIKSYPNITVMLPVPSAYVIVLSTNALSETLSPNSL